MSLAALRQEGVRREEGEGQTAAPPQPPASPGLGLGAAVAIRALTKRYGAAVAVDGVSIDIAAGEFVTFLGPSGSGKTTTMMAIAGFVETYEGEIRIGGQAIDGLPPHRRNVGVLFQHLALFPHMTAADNIAFPLRMRAVPRAEAGRRVQAALDLVRMTGFADRLPGQLSGGQQQRVALARALVFDPPVLLLDEPLGALDRKLRESMQAELRSLHARLGTTIIHVTHDQTEAMEISDRIAVINRGRIEQYGTPRELYSQPANRFVADFVGESVFLDGVVESAVGGICRLRLSGGLVCLGGRTPGLQAGDRATMMLRPERLVLGPAAGALENRCSGTVGAVTYSGDRTRYEVRLPDDTRLVAVLANKGPAGPQPGERVEVGWGLQDGVLLPAE